MAVLQSSQSSVEPETARRFLRPDVLARIGDLELRARRVVEGFVSGMHRSPYRGYSVEFAEHREYVPGDDLRHLDWRVWGRINRLYIKQYEEETNLRTHLVVDCSASMRYPDRAAEGRLSKFEYAATVAASLAFLLTQQQDAIGLTLFDEGVQAELAPAANPAQLRAVVDQLERARVEGATARDGLSRVLSSVPRRRSLVVLLSDLLVETAEIVRALDRLCYEGHEVILMHVLDVDERTFPFAQYTCFEGLETDATLTVDPASLRRSYLEALEAFLLTIRTACIARRIDYVGLSTTDTVDVALRGYLAARASRTKR